MCCTVCIGGDGLKLQNAWHLNLMTPINFHFLDHFIVSWKSMNEVLLSQDFNLFVADVQCGLYSTLFMTVVSFVLTRRAGLVTENTLLSQTCSSVFL